MHSRCHYSIVCFFFVYEKTILFHIPSSYAAQIIYILLYLLSCDYFFLLLYIPTHVIEVHYFFILLLYYSHKTLPEHNANKVPSLKFYVREPNSADPLTLSLSIYISLSFVLYISLHVYTYWPPRAPPSLHHQHYIYIGTLIGHHYPGRYIGRNESKRIERRKKTADISDQFCFTTDINRRPLLSSRLLQKTERKKINIL